MLAPVNRWCNPAGAVPQRFQHMLLLPRSWPFQGDEFAYNQQMSAPCSLRVALVIAAAAAFLPITAGRLPVARAQEAREQPLMEMTDWTFAGFAPLPEVPEPSGMCFHPIRGTLFVVDDGDVGRPAGVYELDLQATVLNSIELGVDLEGICYCAADGLLYICDEHDERVYVVSPDDLSKVGDFQVSRLLDGCEMLLAGGNGFEGIEYIPAGGEVQGDYFLLLNQDDPHALVRVDRADIVQRAVGQAVPLRAFWPLPEINTGELHYDVAAGQLWVIHSWMNVMEVLDIETMEVVRWEVFPGAAQEAVAVDSQGRLWIGYDMGGIARYVRRKTR